MDTVTPTLYFREYDTFQFSFPETSSASLFSQAAYSSPTPESTATDHLSSSSIGLRPPSAEPGSLSLKASLCEQCKGQRYGFTAYFHNPNVFSEPPHHLLSWIEQSYLFRDRLKSLIVTYAMREFEAEGLRKIEDGINSWARDIGVFTTHLLCSAQKFELNILPLEEVKTWTSAMSKQLMDHVQGHKKLEMPRGRLQALLTEFRWCWEAVWLGYLRDEKDPSAQYSGDHGQSDEYGLDSGR